MKTRRLRRCFALIASALLAASAHAQLPQSAPEPDLKAAMVFNFAVFTEWPQDSLGPSMPLRVCAFQGNALQGALSDMQDKSINGHRMTLRLLNAGASASQLASCHVLTLDSHDRERWSAVREELTGASVLTIADDRVIGASGAMISLNIDNHRVGFDVDLGSVRSARLALSSKLLRLARSVQ